MADFFTRLVEHTLGTRPTVQPVIAPLFAPVSVLERNVGNTAFTEAHTVAEPGIFSGSELLRNHVDAVTPAQSTAQSASGISILSERAEASFSHRDHVQPERNALSSIQPLVSPMDTRSDTRPPVDVPSQHARVHSNEGEEQLRGHSPLHRDVQIAPLVRVKETTREEATAQPAQMPALRGEIGQKDISAGRSQSLSAEQPLEASQIVPAIHVSIGHVDVRAILPPAQPSPRPLPARPSSALSLDDYLKQQKGGKR